MYGGGGRGGSPEKASAVIENVPFVDIPSPNITEKVYVGNSIQLNPPLG
jgi:hypothetical protein